MFCLSDAVAAEAQAASAKQIVDTDVTAANGQVLQLLTYRNQLATLTTANVDKCVGFLQAAMGKQLLGNQAIGLGDGDISNGMFQQAIFDYGSAITDYESAYQNLLDLSDVLPTAAADLSAVDSLLKRYGG